MERVNLSDLNGLDVIQTVFLENQDGEYVEYTYCAVCGRKLTMSAILSNGYLYCAICAP